MATAAVLLLVAASAWGALLLPSFAAGAGMPGMAADDAMGTEVPSATQRAWPAVLLDGASFVGAWLVMMAAMMLPSATPMFLLYRTLARGSRLRRAASTAVFVSAYLVVWGAFGLAVYVVQRAVASIAGQSLALQTAWPVVVAAVLAAAGLYQFSRLKEVCLRHCRSPWSFLMQRWRPGALGGFELGLRHGSYCIGCCAGLMAVLVVAGAMGLAWVTLIAFVVFAEKLLPPGRLAGRIVGVVLLILAATVIAVPDMVHRLAVS